MKGSNIIESGFHSPGIPQPQAFLFGIFLFICLCTLKGNVLINAITQVDPRLQKLMYLFSRNILLLKFCYTTVTIPKYLWAFGCRINRDLFWTVLYNFAYFLFWEPLQHQCDIYITYLGHEYPGAILNCKIPQTVHMKGRTGTFIRTPEIQIHHTNKNLCTITILSS